MTDAEKKHYKQRLKEHEDLKQKAQATIIRSQQMIDLYKKKLND